MLNRIAAVLAACTDQGSFAVERACPSRHLDMAVKGVGRIPFPIPPEVASKLIALAKPAPFGRRSKTIHDKRVRDTWEIAGDNVQLDRHRWAPAIGLELVQLQQALGMPATGKLTAQLDKMLIYEPGQFFAPHRDSERDARMVGSLVVELPSAHEGGSVMIEHCGETRVFSGAPRAPDDLSLLAFYADCRHEVKPITAGLRIVLTFHLLYQDATGQDTIPMAPLPPSQLTEHLTAAVDAYFTTPIEKRASMKGSQRPDLLIYLLDHQYTEKSLHWNRLKRMDRTRAEAFREVANRLGCEIFLTLADVHESWSCEDAEDDRDRQRSWHDEDDEETDDDDALSPADDDQDYVLTERFDFELELRHWLDIDGQVVEGFPLSAGPSEVCSTESASELKPFHVEHEGYMGNYGNTVDRWYHRAAILLWPRERHFVIHANASPGWAVKTLAALLAAGATQEAHTKAHDMLAFWNGAAKQEQASGFVADLLAVVFSLDDARLAHGLLAPLGPEQVFATERASRFAELVERHGAPWAQSLFEAWTKHMSTWNPPGWRSLLPGLCATLLAKAPSHGRPFAIWLLEREVAAFEAEHATMLKRPPRRLGIDPQQEADRHGDALLSLLETAATLDATALRNHLLAFLTTPNTALPRMSAARLLQKWHKGRAAAELAMLGLGVLQRYAVEGLAQAVAAPTRAPNDWSIAPPRCPCALCVELSEFLRAPDRIEYAWPLAKDKRQHIHQQIGDYQLPVSHETSRYGRPYTLVLRKQAALFERDAAIRAEEKALLVWLKKHPLQAE